MQNDSQERYSEEDGFYENDAIAEKDEAPASRRSDVDSRQNPATSKQKSK